SGPVARQRIQNGFRNIQPPFNAIYVQNGSRERTICDLIFALTRTRDHLSAPFAARLLLVSMIASDTKDYIQARRSSFVVATYPMEATGDAGDVLLVPMPLAGIFDRKLVGFASNLY